MSQRHKVFVSYHHANDQARKTIFDLKFGNVEDILVRHSVEIGDIDPGQSAEYIRNRIRRDYLSDSTVTVVLVGTHTWQRKHVDWEIHASLRDTASNPRSGLIGLILPSFRAAYGDGPVRRSLLPPRLSDNIGNGFGELYPWTEDAQELQGWIHQAFMRRNTIIPDNSRKMFGRNWTGDEWGLW